MMSMLAISGPGPIKSDSLASSVKTNPVVIRKLLSILRQAGLVEVRMGPQGGALLARAPEELSLRDVYLAIDERVFSLHASPPNHGCPCGNHIQPVLTKVFENAEMAMANQLKDITLADIVSDIQGRMSKKEKNIMKNLCESNSMTTNPMTEHK